MMCKRCVMTDDIPSVVIGKDGVCNYCKMHDQWEIEYPTGMEGTKKLKRIFNKVKREGEGKRYDCIVGVSGGCDSSYLLSLCVDNGLRPLPVHWDNNWNTEIAERNLKRLTSYYGLDIFRVGVMEDEYDDLCSSFFEASTPDTGIPNDIALTKALYVAAEHFDVKYIMNGHSFRTEGTTPLGWSYMDGGYIESVHKQFGFLPLKTFPNLTYGKFKEYISMDVKRIRPLWYVDYNKEEVKKILKERFDWEWYGGHHLENKHTIFCANYVKYRKFNMDLRVIEFSAFIRSGFMNKEVALKELKIPPACSQEILDEIKERLIFNDEEFEEVMARPHKKYTDYETYKSLFGVDKKFFRDAMKKKLIPATFYRKYVMNV